MSIPPFPSFYLIGAERCGVRWLRFNLDQHPDICAPPVDLHFYASPDLMLNRGSRWYRQQFDSWMGEPLLGETSPGYLAWRNRPWEVAIRLHDAAPDARLIAIVRQPLDRLHSAMSYDILRGDLPSREELEADPDVTGGLLLDRIRGGVYVPNLIHFRERFGDRLKILLYDDLVADPRTFYREVLTHIRADDTFVPPEIERVRFGLAVEPPDTSREQAVAMYEPFRSNVDELAAWMGRDLSMWDPAVAAR